MMLDPPSMALRFVSYLVNIRNVHLLCFILCWKRHRFYWIFLGKVIVTLIYCTLAELGVKNNFNTSVFPLVFAIIAAVFTFKYDGEVSDSSGLDSALVALAAGNQVHIPNITGDEDPEANGSMPMLADFR